MNITRAKLKQIIKEESQRFLKESRIYEYPGDYLEEEQRNRYIEAINSMGDAIDTLRGSDMQELAEELDKAHTDLSEALGLIGIY